jgi:methyl-accepting chemotaxis protein
LGASFSEIHVGSVTFKSLPIVCRWRRVRETIPASVREVRNLVLDRSDQVDRLDELETALESKLKELKITIDVRREQGFDAAREAVVQATGKASMDSMRDIVAQIIATENDLLNDRIGTVIYEERNILWTVLIGAGVSIAFRSVLSRALGRR